MTAPGLLLLVGALVCFPASVYAAPSADLELVATVDSPLYVTNSGDDRLFIVQRNGQILIYKESEGVLPTPFLDISALVDDAFGDGGMYTMAFHPDYATNGFFFVSYTADGSPLESVIARYEVSGGDPDLADPNSGTVLISFGQPAGSHNNSQVAFDPNGLLYIGTGDGGLAGGDPSCLAQHDDNFYGKILRIDVDQNVNQPPFYGIPSDNPFADPNDGILDEVWAKGFRHPWRFSFDGLTGDLYIADVGQSTREEIDWQPASSSGGENYGWRVMEGSFCFDPDPIDPDCPVSTPSCFDSSYTDPIFEYDNDGTNCSVTGGFVYRGSAISGLQGLYVFGDVCSALIWALEETSPNVWTRSEIADGSFSNAVFPLRSFGEDNAGELYVILGDEVYRLVPSAGVPALGWVGLVGLTMGLLGSTVFLLRREA